MNAERCDCCEGTEALTPLPTFNRPGLRELHYRVGTHATFLETMVARLSSHRLEDGRRPLKRLTTRAPDDPAIALLDAWATIADVLTFYQERIANEGYLLTAIERRSILELGRLVGYRLRPGVAASVYLAFTLEQGYDIEVPTGTRAQSVPAPGELPQVFETEEALRARTEWNAVAARQTRPTILPTGSVSDIQSFPLTGALNDLRAGDTVLFVCGSLAQPYTVREIEIDAAADRTVVTYAPFDVAHLPTPPSDDSGPIVRSDTGLTLRSEHRLSTADTDAPALTRLGDIVRALKKEPSLPPPSRFKLARSPSQTYSAAADLGPRLLVAFDPKLANTLYAAYANAPVTGFLPADLCHVEALRVRAAPFGHNAPFEVVVTDGTVSRREWPLEEFGTLTDDASASDEELRTISLDAVHDGITPGSWVVIDRADRSDLIVTQVVRAGVVSRADYGITARVTVLLLRDPWLIGDEQSLAVLRGTTVYARSEPLELAEESIEDDVADDEIELDGLYDSLEGGRWLMVTGVRTDVPGLDADSGESVEASELVMLAGVAHDVARFVDAQGNEVELPTDTLHTTLTLAEPLEYSYRRDSVKINANVVRATHGETGREVLGSGDGARPFQRFTLKRSPLTYVAAPTPKGGDSTLEIRVDDVRWPEQDTLLYLGPADRGYVTETDDEASTTVIFGDGEHGARLPSAVENVTAVYRSGIGKGGNVAARQISVLATRALGVKEVVNPQRASGGADPESRDSARDNLPRALLALDRLVSVQDYADFARTFAGIGKASAASLTDGRREIVHLTIAGGDDVPIDPSSDLYRNLVLALNRFGDPRVPLRLALREPLFVFISARVKVLEDYLWEAVEPEVRTTLLDAFGFDRRELGQDVLLGEVIGSIQTVEGVDYVDIDLLDGISETDALEPESLAAKLEQLAASSSSMGSRPKQRLVAHLARIDPTMPDPEARIRPAQIAYLNADLPDTLILTEVTS
jgi:predicted phage baseplate assembly protein